MRQKNGPKSFLERIESVIGKSDTAARALKVTLCEDFEKILVVIDIHPFLLNRLDV